jgi:predicted exporter
MTVIARPAVAIWIAFVAACATLIARSELNTDMAAFLPRSPSPAQQVLVEQARSGVVSRLVLIAIEGAPPETLEALSRGLARRLRDGTQFFSVNNGQDSSFDQERDFLWHNRYLLSPGVVPERFTADGLHHALEDDLQRLRSNLGMLIERTLPNDPTGEMLRLVEELDRDARPHSRNRVWFSNDERRALLVAETRASGLDTDAQKQALTIIHSAFAQARGEVAGSEGARLLVSGPAVFAVRARTTMEQDASRLSLLAIVLVAALILFAYRSPRVLLFTLAPVLTGALAGIAAVAAVFGYIHGITLGFGVTLIGESVDYAVYLFTQTAPGSSAESTLARIWPTLRLGMLTSVAGFSAMLFSSFSGFAQLGLFSITGLIAALGVTRWVLPALLPAAFAFPDSSALGPALRAATRRPWFLRGPMLLLLLAALVLLGVHAGGFWQEDLARLSPTPRAEQNLDQELRSEIGAPDVRYLLLAAGASEQEALRESDRLSQMLTAAVADKALVGFDAPDRYLPSDQTQRARQDALPGEEQLRRNLAGALVGLPFEAASFAPFLSDVAAAKASPLLSRESIPTTLRAKLDSLLFARGGGWAALLPLRGVAEPAPIQERVAALGDPEVAFVDLKSESDRLLQTYQHQGVVLALIGACVIVVLLAFGLRSVARVFVVVAPLIAAVISTTAVVTLGSQKLSIFNLVGLLLIVAVGSNYALFFERWSGDDEHGGRTIASLVLANLCTVVGFGVLALSRLPVLHDIGKTVAIGAFLSLFFATAFANHGEARWSHAIGGMRRRPLP